jgi:hypothetical protein
MAAIPIALTLAICAAASADESLRQESLQRAFIEQRFGMFICYNIMSYGTTWGEKGYDISTFNPQSPDCSQWAEAAASAGMKFGLLTTKHHEGFCLWDSRFTLLKEESWPADGRMKTITFPPLQTRFLKLEILEANGPNAVIAEIAVGAYSAKPVCIDPTGR